MDVKHMKHTNIPLYSVCIF